MLRKLGTANWPPTTLPGPLPAQWKASLDGLGLLIVAQENQLEAGLFAEPQHIGQLAGADAAHLVQHHNDVGVEPDATFMNAVQERIEGANIEGVDAAAAEILCLPPCLRGAQDIESALLPRMAKGFRTAVLFPDPATPITTDKAPAVPTVSIAPRWLLPC
jgi:hypothetical protein